MIKAAGPHDLNHSDGSHHEGLLVSDAGVNR
jgi:hypothetical protein